MCCTGSGGDLHPGEGRGERGEGEALEVLGTL